MKTIPQLQSDLSALTKTELDSAKKESTATLTDLQQQSFELLNSKCFSEQVAAAIVYSICVVILEERKI